MSEYTDLTYYQKTREVILNRAKDYYENNKKKLKSKQKINTKTYLKKKKIKKREHRRNRYRNMSEEKKQRLKEYQKIIARHKSLNIIINKKVF